MNALDGGVVGFKVDADVSLFHIGPPFGLRAGAARDLRCEAE